MTNSEQRLDGVEAVILNPVELHDPIDFGYSHTVSLPRGSELVLIAGNTVPIGAVRPSSGDFASQVE